MKTIAQHIAHVRTKPHHVRKQVAFTLAGAGTAVIAILWLGISLGTGAFALKPTSFADASSGGAGLVASGSNHSANVAGAAAAPGFNSANAPAHIEIVDTSAPKPVKQEQTTISF